MDGLRGMQNAQRLVATATLCVMLTFQQADRHTLQALSWAGLRVLAERGAPCCYRKLTLKSAATDMPRAAEMEVELCPAPKGSYSDSSRLVKPEIPLDCRMEAILPRRPVKILWG